MTHLIRTAVIVTGMTLMTVLAGCGNDDIDITALSVEIDPADVLYNQALANIKAGKLKALATTWTQRISAYPELPTAVTAARVGGLEGSHETYGALGTWAEANRYRLVAPSREIFLAAPRSGHLDEMIAEIQFPAEAVGSSEAAPTGP